MEVICPSCGTRYAIADERVRNRKLRVPCRKCKTPLHVDGTTVGSNTWIVDLGGSEEPMSASEIAELYARGGISDWTRVRARDDRQFQELAAIPELCAELTRRGLVLSRDDSAPRSRPINEPPLAPGAKPEAVDLAAPTRTIQAAELWSAAGVTPLARAHKRADHLPGAQPIAPAAEAPPATLAAHDEEEAATTLYRAQAPAAGDALSGSEAYRVDELLAADGVKPAIAPATPAARAWAFWFRIGIAVALALVLVAALVVVLLIRETP